MLRSLFAYLSDVTPKIGSPIMDKRPDASLRGLAEDVALKRLGGGNNIRDCTEEEEEDQGTEKCPGYKKRVKIMNKWKNSELKR